jgi:hypothetical protein
VTVESLLEVDVRVLTVTPPWPWAIAWGGKGTENRSTGWKYRGPLLIHAGAGWDHDGASDPRLVAAYTAGAAPAEQGRTWETDLIGPRLLPPERIAGYPFHPSAVIPGLPACRQVAHSAVVALTWLVDAHHATVGCGCGPWGEPGWDTIHLVLADTRPLDAPVPYRAGGLGLRRPPVELVAEVVEALQEAA